MPDQALPKEAVWKHLPRFFSLASPYIESQSFELEKRVFQHAIQARRLKSGQFFIIFDGQGAEYLAQINTIERHQATATWRGMQCISRESTLRITLAASLIASDKMDWMVQKAVELGVYAFQPIITQHGFQLVSHRWPEKQHHWEEVAISACEQCARNVLPIIHPLNTLEECFSSVPPNAKKWLLSPHAEQTLGEHLKGTMDSEADIYVLVGPEGGLSVQEETQLCDQRWKRLGLGPRILRAETAALAALSCVQAFHGMT